MTTSRLLPLVNLFGCLLITGIIVTQWLNERRLDAKIFDLTKNLAGSQELYDLEKSQVAALKNDVAQLKESVESTVVARKESEEALAKLLAERDARSATAASEGQAYQEQVKVWEKAIAERDAKIRDLNGDLMASRARLDEAIARIKAASQR